MLKVRLPRLMLAGTGGDCGKTFTSLGLAAAWRREGMDIGVFKKGPDYIDPAWLALAAGKAARNLDTWMMPPKTVLDSFLQHAVSNGVNIIEGNRGLYDGEDAAGSHSSAELAKLLKTPVVPVIPAVKITRTVAALLLGLQMLDPEVEIAGVILNRIATSRQEAVIRASVERYTGLPVLGAIPRIKEDLFPSRHLGLIVPEERLQNRKIIDRAADVIAQSVDLPRLRQIAEKACPLECAESMPAPAPLPSNQLRIGFFQSPAFTFYYPENMEAIERSGATLVPADPLNDRALPPVDALYIGGGFPESHAASLSANAEFRHCIAEAAQKGLPIWAECGGLIYLCRSVLWQGERQSMSGVFPIDITIGPTPAGHGYEEVLVDRPNPFMKTGTTLRGHEFHYSKLDETGASETIFHVKRGTGIGNGRDGLAIYNVVAAYLHLHALGTIEWAAGLLAAADAFSKSMAYKKQNATDCTD